MSANQHSIGLPARELETPALCLDWDVYQRNVARMRQRIIEQHGLGWRPHMKGQKAPPLALEAVRQGALGVTCATVYEAEAMARAGVASILLAHQVAGDRKLLRLARLQHLAEVIAGTDSVAHAHMLNRAAVETGVVMPVIIEVNVGMNRSGVAPFEATIALAREILGLPGLRLRGLMGWEGHTVPMPVAEKDGAVPAALAALVKTAEMCRHAGIAIDIVSAAGSATFQHAVSVSGLTEIQAGGGVFCDLSYQRWGLTAQEFALTVLARVVSRPDPRRAIVDAGFKTLSQDHGTPMAVGINGLERSSFSAEHGTLIFAEPCDSLAVGDTVSFVPGYTDSTVCLHDEICVMRDGVLSEVWPIPGRTGRV